MTPAEQAVVDAISGALAGNVKRVPMGSALWISEGDTFMVNAEEDPGVQFPATCARCIAAVTLVARSTGWVKGVVCVGGAPVDLVIDKARTPFD